MYSRKAAVLAGIVIIFLVIIDLLVTRQVLPAYKDIEVILFVLTVTIGYGIGSWILLGYTKRVSTEIRAKSRFINVMFWTVTVVQFGMFGVLLLVLINNSPSSTRYLSHSVFAISSILATIIMGIISFKFFSWYKSSEYKNFTVLFYGIAALTLGASIAEDVGTKLLMVQEVKENTPPGEVIQSTFQYKDSEKYDAQVVRKEVNPDTTSFLIIPDSSLEYYNLLNSTVLPIAFVFRWIASTTLLRGAYQRIGKLPLSFWIILSLPLILYLVGKMPGFFYGESMAGVDEAYRYYFRILFRAGTIGGNIVFGLAFFVIARRIASSRIKDYLIITGIGDTIVGIALSTSALEPTYGAAAHSLVLLSSYLFSIGLYVCAISLAQDSSLRKTIRKSNIGLVDNIGTAQMEQEVRKRILKMVEDGKDRMEEQTGGLSYSVTEKDVREYVELVIDERKHSTIAIKEEPEREANEEKNGNHSSS
ncbi:MAG: hypothetical protein WB053_08120 [Nitrososphaeraceae archaeon]|jgi:hypothetical protein